MTELEERAGPEAETGYGAAIGGDREGAPHQDQPEIREPVSDEEAAQDNYANTDDEES